MSHVVETWIECDAPDPLLGRCDERIRVRDGESVAEGRARAVADGWTRVSGLDLCPKHSG